jgi:hypothetical protein
MALEMITGYQTRYRSSLHPAPISSTLNMEAAGSTEKNGKGKITLVHAVKAYGVRRGIAPLHLNLRSGRRWVVTSTPRALHPRKRTRVVPTGWVSVKIWDVSKKNISHLPGNDVMWPTAKLPRPRAILSSLIYTLSEIRIVAGGANLHAWPSLQEAWDHPTLLVAAWAQLGCCTLPGTAVTRRHFWP